jgi:hypothetical protein
LARKMLRVCWYGQSRMWMMQVYVCVCVVEIELYQSDIVTATISPARIYPKN